MNVYLTILIAVIGATGAIVGGYFGYKAIRRTSSGSVATSDAATIWQQNTDLRDYLTKEVVALREQLVAAIASVVDLTHQLEMASQAQRGATLEIELAREETRRAREETARLASVIATIHDDVRANNVLAAQVHEEVKTNNALTAGALLDNQESRRIRRIPPELRTDAERMHVDAVGIQTSSASQPGQGGKAGDPLRNVPPIGSDEESYD